MKTRQDLYQDFCIWDQRHDKNQRNNIERCFQLLKVDLSLLNLSRKLMI